MRVSSSAARRKSDRIWPPIHPGQLRDATRLRRVAHVPVSALSAGPPTRLGHAPC